MLSELCKELNNLFNYNIPIKTGDFVIQDGSLVTECGLADGQYFRIVGSVFNDGVYQFPVNELKDETFYGGIWGMAIPQEVIELSEDIDEWKEKFATIDSYAMSPFTSESFGGYSYSKNGASSSSDGSSNDGSWQSVFASRLNNWRKIRP